MRKFIKEINVGSYSRNITVTIYMGSATISDGHGGTYNVGNEIENFTDRVKQIEDKIYAEFSGYMENDNKIIGACVALGFSDMGYRPE